jgi:multidrug efflux pump subunit AcrA (membrane-fusion protein)
VRLGRRNDKQIEILAGLSPGDRVLVQKPDDTGLHQ